MTYPDLIEKFIVNGGGVLLFLGVIIFILSTIIIMAFKYSIMPKVREFLSSLETLVKRVEKNEIEVKEVKHEVDLTKQDFKNTRDLVERIAETSSDHISEMKLLVHEIRDSVEKLTEKVNVINTEHKIYHNEKNNLSDFDIANNHRGSRAKS